MSAQPHCFDVCIIGTGAAGLNCALNIDETARVALISKGSLQLGATQWAQGGIAGVLSSEDSAEAHIQDTLIAGAGLCHRSAVEQTVAHSSQTILALEALGVPFTQESTGQKHLTREGGHSHRRIAHVADATGKAIHEKLIAACQTRTNLQFYSHWLAIDLLLKDGAVVGAHFINVQTGDSHIIHANKVILATGGASRAYLYSTNPDVSSGDGIAMAWRAGCRVANLEFNQFHPTALYHDKSRLLLSEAIRGEGGILTSGDEGHRFMSHYHPDAELAPRDVVARAIDTEMKRLGLKHVWLDISHIGAALVEKRFPTLVKQCLSFGYDLRTGPVPVVPAAHYTCGGVLTDLDGHTDLPNLYAIGEVACTGLHGANRLASNSLLECLVFGKKAAEHINKALITGSSPKPGTVVLPDRCEIDSATAMVTIAHNWDAIRRTMWNFVGICRSESRLLKAQEHLVYIENEIAQAFGGDCIHPHFVELKNLLLISQLIVRSALHRKESRGLHFMEDFPHLSEEAEDTVLRPAACPATEGLTNFQD
ncbi:MAG: L-aspartate oxidase [Legionellales bacterium]|nr:L-aspartate oxidase [Legionellales bacterium]